MCKRFLCACLAALLFFASVVPVFAADDEPSPEVITAIDAENANAEDVSISIANGVIGFGNDEPTQIKSEEEPSGTTVSNIGIYPYEIKYDNNNGSPVVIKSFKVPAGYDPASLVENDFEDSGYNYSYKDILKNDPQIIQDSKLVAQVVTFSSEDNEQTTLMASLSPLIEFSEGGYSGQLELDYNTIQSVVAGKESYSYPVTRTVEYSNLDNNDYAYLDKEVDGLTLQEADWTAQEITQRGSTMLPTAYNATAVYTGVGYGSRVTGYNNTAIYKGTVTRTFEGETIYSIIYQGKQITSDFPWKGAGIGLGIIVAIGALVLVLLKILPSLFGRRRRTPPTPPEDVPVQF